MTGFGLIDIFLCWHLVGSKDLKFFIKLLTVFNAETFGVGLSVERSSDY